MCVTFLALVSKNAETKLYHGYRDRRELEGKERQSVLLQSWLQLSKGLIIHFLAWKKKELNNWERQGTKPWENTALYIWEGEA